MDKKISEYVNKQSPLQKEIVQKIRKIFLETLKDPQEKSGWGVIVYGNDKFYLAGIKDRVHVGFAITGLNKDEIANFEGSGKTMRHIKINSLKDINKKELKKLIKLVDKKVKKVHHK